MWVDIDEGKPNNIIKIANFFDGIAALMAYSAECELPFRVGVAFGECFIDQETNRYLGQPIIDAYLVEPYKPPNPVGENAPVGVEYELGVIGYDRETKCGV